MTSTEVTTDSEDSGPSGYAAARLRLLQEKAQSGPPRRAALASLTDDWLTALFTTAAEATGVRGAALVAVGGYGRGELSPRSDLDLLLLHDGNADPGAIASLADRIWYPVWDLGLALDHSVRTPAEARKTAGEDLKVQLGLLDARPVAGDLGLVAAMRTTILADWRNLAPKRLPALDELCRERAERQGELQFLLEPDLKEARGGLRDATALRAVAASWVADAPREGLAEARRVLLDARDALHLTTGRATDRLALQEQDQVATALGLLDADALLRQVYEAARTVSYATDVTWREVNRVLRARSVRPRLRAMLGGGKATAPERTPLADGVVEADGEVVLARTARPERDPVLVLRAAAAAAQSELPISRHVVRHLATAARPLPVPWPAEAREELVTLLGAGEATIPVWEALEAEGLITRLLPDWERVHCRPQRNPVHTWTVDRHLVEAAVRASSSPAASAAPTSSSSPPCCTTSARAGPATTPSPEKSSPATSPPGSASTSTTWASSPPSYVTICCSSRPPPAATSTTRRPSGPSPPPSGPRPRWNSCTPSPRPTRWPPGPPPGPPGAPPW